MVMGWVGNLSAAAAWPVNATVAIKAANKVFFIVILQRTPSW
jgi:hypothetical protein